MNQLRNLMRENARNDRQRNEHRDDHDAHHECRRYRRTIAEARERPLVQRPADDSQNARQQNGREKRLHYKVATKKNQSAETDS